MSDHLERLISTYPPGWNDNNGFSAAILSSKGFRYLEAGRIKCVFCQQETDPQHCQEIFDCPPLSQPHWSLRNMQPSDQNGDEVDGPPECDVCHSLLNVLYDYECRICNDIFRGCHRQSDIDINSPPKNVCSTCPHCKIHTKPNCRPRKFCCFAES